MSVAFKIIVLHSDAKIVSDGYIILVLASILPHIQSLHIGTHLKNQSTNYTV